MQDPAVQVSPLSAEHSFASEHVSPSFIFSSVHFELICDQTLKNYKLMMRYSHDYMSYCRGLSFS